ncbi:MAG: HAD family hydrolase [Muribaculaceae bacterium]|nr:HAD family hydrolase [Muribaculaceae bacterium]
MSKTLYITDMDGTLLDSSSRISERSASLLNRAIDSGALFSIATARTPATVSVLTRHVNLRLPLVVMTGVALWHRDTNVYTDVCHFDPETVNQIREVYRHCDLPAFLYTLRDNMIYIYHSGPLSATERHFVAERAHSPYKRFLMSPDGESDIPQLIDDAVLFFAMQPTEPAQRAYGMLRDVAGVNPICYYDPTYGPGLSMSEAFPADASKANATRKLARRCGAERIVAFGDNANDIPLLQLADVAVAVENAIPEVKEIADIIIPDNNMDSVAEFILDDYLQTHDNRSRLLTL